MGAGVGLSFLFFVVCAGVMEAYGDTPAAQIASFHPSRPVVIAHRGASEIAPENTLAALRVAAKLGVAAVEFDVHASRDGHIVLMHDHTLQRTTTGKGRVARHRLSQLRNLDAGSWFEPRFSGEPIPTLHEALGAIGTTMVACIEIKSGTVALPKVAEALKSTGTHERAIIFSFLPKQIQRSKAVMPAVPALLLVELSALVSYSSVGLVEQVTQSNADMLGLDHRGVTPELVEALHQSGLPVFVYTVDAPADVRRVVESGVDGIISNQPRATLSRVFQHRPRSK